MKKVINNIKNIDKSKKFSFSGGLTLLTIALAVLKGLGYINLAWMWVFAPLWIPAAIVLGVFIIGTVLAILFIALDR